YLSFPQWNKKGNGVYFQWMNRGQDHIKILYYDLKTHHHRQVYEEKQKAWVLFFTSRDLFLLNNGDLILRSSKDGWFHIYHVPFNGKERQITSGEWSVEGISYVDERKKRIYFSARREASTERDFYRTGFDGKQVKRLTAFKGSHRVRLSTGGSYFIDSYSSVTTAARMELRDDRGLLVRKLGDSYSKAVEKYE
ncbi:MAG: S9 family peptidase, partial [bacterium]|nr:S9 family peptidase [bacterium]